MRLTAKYARTVLFVLLPWSPNIEHLVETVQVLDLTKLRYLQYPTVDACVWEAATFDGWQKGAAKAFHRIRPVAPHRTHVTNALSNVKEAMNR